MSTNTVYCHVLGGNVSVVSDLNGHVTNVICPKFSRITHGCLIKFGESSSGLAYAAKRAADKIANTRGSHCEFVEVGDSPMTKFVDRLFGND